MKENVSPRIGFFASAPHSCGYLSGREATTLFADPRVKLTTAGYSWLSAHGFRRSGAHVYRPHCSGCAACVAVRVAATEFAPSRAQRRTLARNADITVTPRPACFEPEHFALYNAYLQARHPDSQMEATSPSAYMSFLTAEWSDTTFHEFRLDHELVAVAVVDRLADGLSAVYTFFSPNHPARSLGRLAVLKQIEWAAAAGLRWLYLGYWIEDCRKMRYKSEFRPQQQLCNGIWA